MDRRGCDRRRCITVVEQGVRRVDGLRDQRAQPVVRDRDRHAHVLGLGVVADAALRACDFPHHVVVRRHIAAAGRILVGVRDWVKGHQPAQVCLRLQRRAVRHKRIACLVQLETELAVLYRAAREFLAHLDRRGCDRRRRITVVEQGVRRVDGLRDQRAQPVVCDRDRHAHVLGLGVVADPALRACYFLHYVVIL